MLLDFVKASSSLKNSYDACVYQSQINVKFQYLYKKTSLINTFLNHRVTTHTLLS
jgi:gluconate kinase